MLFVVTSLIGNKWFLTSVEYCEERKIRIVPAFLLKMGFKKNVKTAAKSPRFWSTFTAFASCVAASSLDFPVCSSTYLSIHTLQLFGCNAFSLVAPLLLTLWIVDGPPEALFNSVLDALGALFCFLPSIIDFVSYYIVEMEHETVAIMGPCYDKGLRIGWVFNLIAAIVFMADLAFIGIQTREKTNP